MFRPILDTAPAVPLISLVEIKGHCRVDSTDDDTLLTAMVDAATDHLDGWPGVLGRCLVNQVWRQDFAKWVKTMRLPFGDITTVVVKYSDVDDAEQTVSSALYEVLEDHRGSFVCFRDAFTNPALYDDRSEPVRITLTAGYGAAAADVPQAIRHAAMMLVGHWYEQREAVAWGNPQVAPMAVQNLIAPFRRNLI